MCEEKKYSRVHANIDLDAASYNMDAMHQLLKEGTKMFAVIKTDGYGHGAVEIAHKIEALDYLFGYCVATVEEAMILRRHEVKKPVLILGYTFPEQYATIVANEIRPTVISYEMAKQLSDEAVKQNKNCYVHIKADTGMSRIGYQVTEESAEEIAQIAALPNIVMEGIFTHFARADETDKTAARHQYELFCKMIGLCEKKNVTFLMHHCSNSAGIVDLPEYNMDAVRAGITLYGLWPSDEVHKERICLHPLLELKSQVAFVKQLSPGREISYGGTYVVQKEMTVATIPVGYGDGYPRGLSNKGYVLIHGQEAPILGRVCMDQFMVDVTDIADVHTGTEVTLVGKDGEKQITLEELGELSGRFNYEFACDLGRRIPRVYYENGKRVFARDYFGE